ncbi:unnamed protein product [Durusdinium trenchii]|uniref:Uncharacterized protein n=1 Tax=Durusdinium trenchii TaxID=1381693 RepID=A0ABP0MTU5_9DINO
MTITNFEMEPTPAPPVVKQVGVPLWMKLCMVALFLLAAFTIWRVEGTADERAEIQDQVMDLQSELRRLKKETAWSKEKKDLLVRAAQAEKGEKALNKELKRVHAELQRAYALQQGKDPPNISIPDLEEEEEEEIIEADKRPDEPPPYAYNSCQQEEHQVLCELIKDDNDAVIDKSRKCGRKALSLMGKFRKHKFKNCMIEEVPELSDKCAMCFADAGHWGYNNCMGSCMSKGEGCEKCMVDFAEDARKCMGFLLTGYWNIPADCPVQATTA